MSKLQQNPHTLQPFLHPANIRQQSTAAASKGKNKDHFGVGTLLTERTISAQFCALASPRKKTNSSFKDQLSLLSRRYCTGYLPHLAQRQWLSKGGQHSQQSRCSSSSLTLHQPRDLMCSFASKSSFASMFSITSVPFFLSFPAVSLT